MAEKLQNPAFFRQVALSGLVSDVCVWPDTQIARRCPGRLEGLPVSDCHKISYWFLDSAGWTQLAWAVELSAQIRG